MASGSGLTPAQFLQPGQLARRRRPGRPTNPHLRLEHARIHGFFEHFVQIVILLIAWLVVVVSFFVLAIQLFIAILEFKLTTLAGFVLVPFALWKGTAFLAERVLGNVISSGIKILVLAVIVGIGTTLFGQFTERDAGHAQPQHGTRLVLASLALFGLGIFGPGIAGGLVAGAPQLGAGAAIGTAAGVVGLGMLGAGAAGLGARGDRRCGGRCGRRCPLGRVPRRRRALGLWHGCRDLRRDGPPCGGGRCWWRRAGRCRERRVRMRRLVSAHNPTGKPILCRRRARRLRRNRRCSDPPDSRRTRGSRAPVSRPGQDACRRVTVSTPAPRPRIKRSAKATTAASAHRPTSRSISHEYRSRAIACASAVPPSRSLLISAPGSSGTIISEAPVRRCEAGGSLLSASSASWQSSAPTICGSASSRP